jgi:hypothetical protein
VAHQLKEACQCLGVVPLRYILYNVGIPSTATACASEVRLQRLCNARRGRVRGRTGAGAHVQGVQLRDAQLQWRLHRAVLHVFLLESSAV